MTYEAGNAGLANDEESAYRAQASVKKLFGDDALCDYEGTLAGEDFSEYLARVPGAFVFLGCRNPHIDAVHAQHSCYYRVDESTLAKGAMLYTQYAIDFLNE